MVVTAPGATARGRVVFEDGAKPDNRLFVRTAATVPGASFSNTSVGVNADLSFTVGGLTDRQTFRLGIVPDGWFLKSVTHEGKDLTDTGYDFKPGEQVSGIQIGLTRRATTMTGTVQAEGGAPVSDYSVVAFSADRSKWGYLTRFVRSTRPDQDAKFTIRALPPDDYLVVALEYSRAASSRSGTVERPGRRRCPGRSNSSTRAGRVIVRIVTLLRGIRPLGATPTTFLRAPDVRGRRRDSARCRARACR